MTVYLVWEYDNEYGFESIVKAFQDEKEAESFIKYRDKMTGCEYRISEIEVI